MTCKHSHFSECVNGWVYADQRVVVRRDGEETRQVLQQDTVEPCPVCRPGRRAVWEQKLDQGQAIPWQEDPAALRAFAEHEELSDKYRRMTRNVA